MPRTRQPEAARHEQILAAAYQVAAREGLDGTTIIQVAVAAKLSPGLVIFHFKSKRQLLLGLLDRMLDTTTMLHIGDDIARLTSPLDQLIALLHQEMDRLTREPLRIRLMFDYWAAGIRDVECRNRLRAEFERYRDAFRPLAAAVLREEKERFVGVTPDGLAAVAVSFIKGCAVQAMIDPEGFDINQYLAAAEGLLAQIGAPWSNA